MSRSAGRCIQHVDKHFEISRYNEFVHDVEIDGSSQLANEWRPRNGLGVDTLHHQAVDEVGPNEGRCPRSGRHDRRHRGRWSPCRRRAIASGDAAASSGAPRAVRVTRPVGRRVRPRASPTLGAGASAISTRPVRSAAMSCTASGPRHSAVTMNNVLPSGPPSMHAKHMLVVLDAFGDSSAFVNAHHVWAFVGRRPDGSLGVDGDPVGPDVVGPRPPVGQAFRRRRCRKP